MYINLKINRFISITIVLILILSSCLLFLSGKDTAIYASKIQDSEISVPILMYHSILKDKARQGQYVISPDDLETDLIYLKNNGYTTVTINDLIEYTEGKGDLPEKPIILSFDDGYYNNYVYAYPLFKKYHAKFVLAVIGTYSEQFSQSKELNAYYSHCTWDMLKEISDSGIVEIQNHSFNMHFANGKRMGTRQNKNESNESYKKALLSDISKNQELLKEKTGISCNAFVYPFGAYNEFEDDILKEFGFKATVTCNEKNNIITKNPDCLYLLGRYLRSSGRSAEKILTSIN